MACLIFACSGNSKPATPSQTLAAYHLALQKKDVEMVKLLLSKASLKIHEDQAKVQNTTVDEIVLRETLFSPDQRKFYKKDEKIEGDNATVDVKNDFGGWDTIHLVKEEGIWKIDKKGTSEQILEESEEADEKLDEQIRKSREQDGLDPESTDNTNSNQNTETNSNAPPADQTDPPGPLDNPVPQRNDPPKSLDNRSE
ncbi:MAG: DUF4878 domain-containing protein [Pyrinomonadaceae bacterium]|nr:DUF4878 domain-containing protein [Pyrinomonadaceae bacterium]